MEQKVFELILKEDEISWQTLLMELVRAEGMNPWDIDVSKIAHSYIKSVKKMKEMNLRLSGKVVLASALLLHYKSKQLIGKELEELDRLFSQSQDDYEDEEFDDISLLEPFGKGVSQKPKIYPKMPQPRHRKVSIQDLVKVLEKSMDSKKRVMANKVPQNAPKLEGKNPIDITSLIVTVFDRIKKFFKTKKKLTFTQLTPSSRRKDKVYTFIPLLHLYNDGKIDIHQEHAFGEIQIELK